MDAPGAKGQPEMVRGMEHHEERLGELGLLSLQRRGLCRDIILEPEGSPQERWGATFYRDLE